MTGKTLISLENVGVKYQRRRSLLQVKKTDAFWALKNVSFEVKKDEVIGVIGKNGAGKSTLLSLMSQIIAPSSGRAVFNTEKISLLSLQAGFVPFLSGRKNIILGGMLYGLTRSEITRKIDEVIDFSEIRDFIDEPVITYSTGMKARLGFSVALALNPDVILIDEVLGVGDVQFKRKSTEALKERIKNHMTAVIVSHSVRTISELCGRVVVINKGKSIFTGDTDQGLAIYESL